MPRQSKEVTSVLIQDTAIKLFSEKGYKEITMVEIARKANIAKRTLYKYYPSKITLFASIFERYLQMLINKVKYTDYQGLTYGEILKKALVLLYDFTNEHQGFMRLFWMINNESLEGGDFPDELNQQINHWNTELVNQMAEFLNEKQPKGLFQKYSPELVTHMVSSINKGIYLQITKEASLGIKSPSHDDLLNLFCEMILCCDN
jgi:AcrR family transcriptional regulator